MFGWVFIGREQTDKTYTNDLQTFFVSSEPENLQRFCEIEEVPAAQLWTIEEKGCDDHFKETTRKRPEDSFIVKLPLKNETKALTDSLQQDKKRLRSLLFRLERQPDLYKRYAEFIGEFFHLGHMKKFPTSELIKPVENCYDLCHHCVFRESSIPPIGGSFSTDPQIRKHGYLLTTDSWLEQKFGKTFSAFLFDFDYSK